MHNGYAQKTAVRPKSGNPGVSSKTNKTKKINKTNKTIEKEIKKSKGVFFAKILFFTFVIMILVTFAANLHKINSAKTELDSLTQQYNSDRIRNDALEQELKATIDDDYIANVVKGLGYRKAGEILFYLDSDN